MTSQSQEKGAREAFMCSASNRSLFPHVTVRDRRHLLFGENLEQAPGNEPSQCIRLHRPSMTRCKVFPDESSTTRALFCEVLQGLDGYSGKPNSYPSHALPHFCMVSRKSRLSPAHPAFQHGTAMGTCAGFRQVVQHLRIEPVN